MKYHTLLRCFFFKNNNQCMIFHENRLAGDSHEYHTLFFSKNKKDVAKLSSAAVVIGALWVKYVSECSS